ncbi:hypothetical protein [Lysinibacillus sp. NPDC086135]|uniref:hypothetical protein n=1 Tax=Lysinibacillus sp. NPDC086135 TaxID=3364130 RepID=UPI003811C24B
MKSYEFKKLIMSGYRPVVKMKEDVYLYIEESVDPFMMGRVIGVEDANYSDSYGYILDMSEFVKYNKSVTITRWKDDLGFGTKTWFDTNHYPEDHKETLYFKLENDIPFEIVDNYDLVKEYLDSEESAPYMTWLENLVIKLRN